MKITDEEYEENRKESSGYHIPLGEAVEWLYLAILVIFAVIINLALGGGAYDGTF